MSFLKLCPTLPLLPSRMPMPFSWIMAHSRLPLPFRCAACFKRRVVMPTWTTTHPRYRAEAAGSDAAWALNTASKVQRIFKDVPAADACEFVQSIAEKLHTSAQLEGMMTSTALVTAVKEAVASEMQLLRLEMRPMFAVIVIGLLLPLGSSSVGAPFVACLMKVMT